MAEVREENFKVCGLCSQLVDESVQLNASLRLFLIDLLAVKNGDLPSKVCTDCYGQCYNAKKFRERCERAMEKLRNTKLSDSMILGRSSDDKKQIEAVSKEMPKAAAVSAAKSKAKPAPKSKKAELPPVPAGPRSTRSGIVIDSPGTRPARLSTREAEALGPVPDLGPRTSRRSGALTSPPPVTPKAAPAAAAKPGPRSTRGSGSQTGGTISVVRNGRRGYKVDPEYVADCVVSHVERNLAEQAAELGGTLNYRKRKGALLTPTRTPGRANKRAKVEEPPSVSSFGRVRKPKKTSSSYVTLNSDDEEDPIGMDDDTPLKSSRASRRSGAAQREPTPPPSRGSRRSAPTPREPTPPPPKSKAGPASKKKNKPAPASKSKKGNYYYVDDENQPADIQPVVEEEEDEEEIFPSIGPYQCEICQVITQTKQEFVDHIKKFHRDVVDEEVLVSLENDLRKSKKKQKTKAAVNGGGGGGGGASRPAPTPSPAKSRVQTQAEKAKKAAQAAQVAAAAKKEKEKEAKRKKMEAEKKRKSLAKKREEAIKREEEARAAKKAEPVEDVAMRTCPHCGHVVAKASQLSRHQMTNACIASRQGTTNSPDSTTPNDSATANNATATAKPPEEASVGIEEEDESQNPLHWKNSVARKYEQETSKEEGLNGSSEPAVVMEVVEEDLEETQARIQEQQPEQPKSNPLVDEEPEMVTADTAPEAAQDNGAIFETSQAPPAQTNPNWISSEPFEPPHSHQNVGAGAMAQQAPPAHQTHADMGNVMVTESSGMVQHDGGAAMGYHQQGGMFF